MARRKKEDDWIEAAIGVGIGVLALYFLKKLAEKTPTEVDKVCPYCGTIAAKWARSCPNCRNTLPV